MNIMSLRTWTGIGFILLFLLNASLFIAGLLLGSLWCTISGVLLVLFQLRLHNRFSRAHHVFNRDTRVVSRRDRIDSGLFAKKIDDPIDL